MYKFYEGYTYENLMESSLCYREKHCSKILQQMLFFRPKMIDFPKNLLFLSVKMHKIMYETELSEHFLEFWVWTKWSMKSWNVNSCTNVSKDFKHKVFMENWMIPNIHKITLWVRYWLSKNDQNIVLCMI